MMRPAIAGARLGWQFHRGFCRSGLLRSARAAIVWGLDARAGATLAQAAKRSLRR